MPTLALDLPIDLLVACFVDLSSNLRLLSTLSLVSTSWHEATLRAFDDALRWRTQNRSVSTIMHQGLLTQGQPGRVDRDINSKIPENPSGFQALRSINSEKCTLVYLSAYTPLLGGPEGPEPALGGKKPGLSHSGRFAAATKQQKFSPNKPGGRAIFL